MHISSAIRTQTDGPMLREGIQAFHGTGIALPSAHEKCPDPERLAIRLERFTEADEAA